MRSAILAAAMSVAAVQTADACRCVPPRLDASFANADVVLHATLESVEPRGDELALRFVAAAPVWKPAVKDTAITVLTAASTASCGIEPRPGATYLVFAARDGDAEALRVHACDGTRIWSAGDEAPPPDFPDAPARFVAQQLDALAGMEVLRAVAAGAPDAADPANEALVGLLDLKALAHGGTVPLRAAPRADAALLVTVDSYGGVESREVDYEVAAAVVSARVDGWSRVTLADGRAGWVAPEDAGTWFPYAELPVTRLAYLNEHWSGFVWPDPGAGLPARSARKDPAGREEYAVDVHESTLVGGLPWFRVSILAEDPCEGGSDRAELTGWVPGYGADGQPSVWYWSRGC